MRILQLCSADDIGGGERYVADLSNSLVHRGQNVFFATRPNSALLADLNNIPNDHILPVGMRNAADIPSAFRIATFGRKIKADLIHGHLGRDYPLAAVASKASGIPFVLTRHVLFPMKRVHKFILHGVSGVIAPSSAIYDSLIDNGIFQKNIISMIRHGIDVERFSFAQRVPHDTFTIGTIGHIAPIKGHDLFVRAADIVLKQKPDVSFVILGEDKSPDRRNRAELAGLIESLGLQDKVKLAGWAEDVRPFFWDIDLFVSAARSEPFGLVIAEAMISGIPVIATRSEGAAEIVEDGVSGVHVPLEDPVAIATAILGLASDRSLRNQLAENARKRVIEHFSLNRMIDETMTFYRSIIEPA